MRCRVASRHTILALTAGALALASPLPAQTSARPNFLWISCEDISPHLGSWGVPEAATPNLDRLAAEGVRYVNAFAPIGVCAPARSAIITGMWPNSIGTQHMRCQGSLPAGVRCFPAHLRAAGYYCSNNSKTDYNFPVPPGTWDESGGRAHWRRRPPGQPFFSVFNLTMTHESQIRLPDARFAERTRGLAAHERHDPARVTIPPYHPDTPIVRRDWARYHDLITVMDHRAGEILRELAQDGLAEDTIVFFWSDHGAGLPRSKRWLYDSSLRVPLIVRVPLRFASLASGRAGTACTRLVTFVDFAPTMMSLAGLPLPPHLQGVAFLGPAAGEPRRYVYGFRDRMDERYDLIRCVRDERFKLIRNFLPHLPYAQHIAYGAEMPTWQEWERLADAGELRGPERDFWAARKPPEELYDTWADPHEVHNLAGEADHLEVRARLRRALDHWMADVRDLGFLPESELCARFPGRAAYDAVRATPELYPYDVLRSVADRIGDPRIVDDAPLLFAHPDPAVRWWALTALEARGEAPTVEIRKMLADPAAVVRLAAASTVCRLAAVPEAFPVLERLLRSDDPWIRLGALLLADRLDEGARPLRPGLQRALTSKDGNAVKVARKALADLGR